MTTNSKASLALVVGTLAGLLTMLLHPTTRDVVASLAGGGHGNLNKFAHSLALFAQPLLLMGTLVLTLRLQGERDLAVAAYVMFAWASVAIMIATAASGFIATSVLATAGSHGRAADHVSNGLHYTGLMNRAFAKIYVAFASLAIGVWSGAMLGSAGFPRALAVYGVLSGASFLAAMLTGWLGLGIHGFGSVVLAHGIWFIWVAVVLRRLPRDVALE